MPEFFNQILLLLKANIKVRYRQTWVGFFWVLLNPILVYVAQLMIFQQVFKHDDPNYPLYLMSGLFPWFFLSQTVEMSCTQLKANALLARNLRIGPIHVITSLVFENYLNFFCYFILTSFVMNFFFEVPIWFVLSSLAASVPFFVFVACVSFSASLLHTLFKDIKYIAHFLFTLLYFLTPTFYKMNFLSEGYRQIVHLNPMYWQLQLFRLSLEPTENTGTLLSVNFLFLAVVITACFLLWQRLRARVYLKL